jgi:hypothetical protein
MEEYEPHLRRLGRVVVMALVFGLIILACTVCSGVMTLGELLRRLFGL